MHLSNAGQHTDLEKCWSWAIIHLHMLMLCRMVPGNLKTKPPPFCWECALQCWRDVDYLLMAKPICILTTWESAMTDCVQCSAYYCDAIQSLVVLSEGHDPCCLSDKGKCVWNFVRLGNMVVLWLAIDFVSMREFCWKLSMVVADISWIFLKNELLTKKAVTFCGFVSTG